MQNYDKFPNISNALNDKKTSKNFKKMIEIGTEHFHESGFAIYKLGSHVVSKLIVPEFESLDVMDVDRTGSHSSLCLSELWEIEPKEGIGAAEYSRILMKEAIKVGDYSGISNGTIEAIKRIKLFYEFNPEDQDDHIDFQIDKELKSRGLGKVGIRNDLSFVFHNHPQKPDGHRVTSNLVTPSEQDVVTHAGLAKDNSGIINGIIGSDKADHGLLLFASRKDAKLEPLNYESDYYSSLEKIIKSLGNIGCASVFLDLNSNGMLKPGQDEILINFCNSIN